MFGRFSKFISSFVVLILLITVLSPVVLADTTPSCISLSPDYQFSASANITSAWSGHANVEFTFTNTGSNKIENWNFIFDIPYTIENIWNGQISDFDGDKTYTISAPSWSPDIEVGASVTVGMTLASEDGSEITELPSRYILNTARETVDPSNYSISYVEQSRWDEGFTGILTIRAAERIEDWSLEALTSEELIEASGAILANDDNGRTTLSNNGDIRDIETNASVNIQIRGINTTGYLELTDIVMTTSKRAHALSDDENENGLADYLEAIGITPSPTPTQEITITPEPTVTEIPSPTITADPTITEIPSPIITQVIVPTVTAEPTVTNTPTPEPSGASVRKDVWVQVPPSAS